MESIRPVKFTDLAQCLSVIQKSFGTVAKDFGLTEDNCPAHPSFMKLETLEKRFERGYLMFGLYENEQLGGFASLTKTSENECELRNLAVLPECRRKGYGEQLLDFCRRKARDMGCSKIKISIIEENTILKNWYLNYGFVHTHTIKYDHLPFTAGYMEIEA
jgi:ribosomal protein S18 acetylase RimI-like enzyme